MKNLIITTLCATVFSTVCGAGALNAADVSGGENRPHLFAKGLRAHLAEELELTQQQREGIRSILQSEKPSVAPVVRNLIEARRALRDEIAKGPGNENGIRAQSAKVAAVEADLALHRARIRSKIDNVLTPTQREKAGNLRAKFEARVDDFAGKLETL